MNKTISELIAELESLRAAHGDLPCFVSVYTGGDHEDMEPAAQVRDASTFRARSVEICGQRY